MLPFYSMKKGGFTLIEILVVVAIISILVGSVLVGLGPAQRQGRDTRRIADLRQIQNALELYFAKCGYYPGTAQSTATCGAYQAVSTWGDLTTALTGSSLGVSQIPNDPTSGKNYVYGSDGTGYVLGATLEDPNNPVLQRSVKGTNYSVTCSGAVYCVTF